MIFQMQYHSGTQNIYYQKILVRYLLLVEENNVSFGKVLYAFVIYYPYNEGLNYLPYIFYIYDPVKFKFILSFYIYSIIKSYIIY